MSAEPAQYGTPPNAEALENMCTAFEVFHRARMEGIHWCAEAFPKGTIFKLLADGKERLVEVLANDREDARIKVRNVGTQGHGEWVLAVQIARNRAAAQQPMLML